MMSIPEWLGTHKGHPCMRVGSIDYVQNVGVGLVPTLLFWP